MVLATILVLVSLAFVLAEVLFPSFGLFSLIAAGTLFIADWLAFHADPTMGWIFLGAELILVPMALWVGFRVLPHTRLGQHMLLRGSSFEAGAATPDHAPLIGLSGSAETDLRPGGIALVDGKRASVVALGGYLDRGTPVTVVAVEGTEIRVRAISAEPGPVETP